MEVDWALVSVRTIRCQCGHEFRGKSEFVSTPESFTVLMENPCPSCGRTERSRGVRSDPEVMTIGEGETCS